MRRAARVDANQADIVRDLRKIGAGVTSLASLGHGVSDLLVSFRQRWYVMEVKSEDGEHTPDQIRWIGEQRAPVYTVRSSEQAIAFLTSETPDWLLGLEVKAMSMRSHVCEGPARDEEDAPGRERPIPIIERVRESLVLHKSKKLSVNSLCEMLGVSKASKRVEKALRELCRQGLVQREGNNRNALYWSTTGAST